nr:hypothetical protein [Tanacetum cinerariifolium]
VSVPTSPVYDRYKSGEGYHAVPPFYTGTFMPLKPDLVFYDAPTVSETAPTIFNVKPDCDYYKKKMVQKPVWNHTMRVNHQNSARMTNPHSKKNIVLTAVLTKFRLVPLNAARPVTIVVPQTNMKHQRPANHVVNKPYSPIRRPINHIPSPKTSNFHHKVTTVKAKQVNVVQDAKGNWGNLHQALKDKGVIDSGCSRHMTRNISYLSTLKKSMVDMLHLVEIQKVVRSQQSVSHMRDKKNSVLFTDTECVVLSSDFKLPNENHVLLSVPRENNMYSVDLRNIVPSKDLTFLFTKATLDESNLWRRRLGYINFKTMNKLVKSNLVRGLPSKFLKIIILVLLVRRESTYSQSLQRLHMDLFGPTFVKSLNKKSYCLVVADDYSRFSWVFFLATKDETSTILKTFITGTENQINHMAEAVNTAYYVQNRVLVTKPRNKTPYELLLGRSPSIEFMRPFGCLNTILNTLDPLRKFDGKANEGFLVGYSVRSGATWLFDIDTLTQSMNYQPVNPDADAACDDKETQSEVNVSPSIGDKTKKHDEKAKREAKGNSPVDLSTGVRDLSNDFEEFSVHSTNRVNAAITAVGPNSTDSTNSFSVVGPSNTVVSPSLEIGGKYSFVDPSQYPDDPNMLALEDIIYSDDEEEVAPQTRSMTRVVKDQGGLTQINNEDFHTCMFACFLSQDEPKRVHQSLKDPSWIEAMQEELLKFKMQKVWVLVDLPKGKRAICLKWVFKNKKDERGIVIRNKARLVAHGHTQDEGIDYEEVFDPVARIEAIRLVLAYASFMSFMVYQWMSNVLFFMEPLKKKSMFVNLQNLKTLIILIRSIKWSKHSMGYIKLLELGLQVKQKDNRIFISQDKYVAEILKKFSLTDGKSASTPIDTKKPLLKDPDGEDVDIHIYRYLKGKPYLGLWYPKDSPFNQVAYSVSDYAGASLDRKSITRGCQFLDCRLISWQCKKQTIVATSSTEAEYVDVEDAAEDENDVNEVSAEPTLPSPTPATPSPSPTQEHIPSPPPAQTAQPSSSPPPQPSQSTDISMTLLDTLLETCATLTKQVSNLEQDKITQAIEITKLKQRRMHPNKGEIAELDANKDVTLEEVDAKVTMDADVQGRLAESQAKVYHLDLEHAENFISMQDTDETEPAKVEEVIEVVIAAKLMTEVVTTAATTITVAQVPKASAPRRRRGVIIQDPEETATASVIVHSEVKSKDKGKGILIEEPKSLKRQARIKQDEAFARELEAELNANINWNDVMKQVKRKEKQDNTVMRYQALKRKPVTKARARKNKMVYLKNMVRFKMDFFKGVTYNDIRPIFEKHYNLNQAFLERVKEEVTDDFTSGKEIPFERFTLEQMLYNVRLEIEEESEMSLDLLSKEDTTYPCLHFTRNHVKSIPNTTYPAITYAVSSWSAVKDLTVNVIDYGREVKDDVLEPEGGNVLPEKLLDLDSTKDLHPPHHVKPLSGSTTSSSSPNQLLEDFVDELALITFLPGNDDLSFDIKSDLKEIEYLLRHDPIKDINSILKDSIDQSNLADLNNNLVDSLPEMFTDEHALYYSSPPLYDEYDDDLFEDESDNEYVYDDPFDSKGEKIKEFKLLIDELDLPSDFLLPFEYDSLFSKDFSKVDALPLTNNEDKVFNPCILTKENLFEIITRVTPDKKPAISHASSILKDFDPPLYELLYFREVPHAETPLSFSSENEEKVFKPEIHTSKEVHSFLILELSHHGYKFSKSTKFLKSR